MENENNNLDENITQEPTPVMQNMDTGTNESLNTSVPESQENLANPSVEIPPQQTPTEPTSVETKPTEQTQSMAPILDPEDQKKKKGILPLIIALIAILVVAGIFFLPKLLMSDKKVVENEITTLFTAAKKTLKKSEKNILDFDLEKDSLGIQGTLTIDSNYKEDEIDLSKLKNYKISYQGAIDKKSNEASAKLGLLKDTKNLISADGYINGKKVLISLGDLYEKTITTEIDTEIKDLDFSKSGSIEDIEKLLEKTEKIVKNSVKDENIKKSKEEKEINGKKDNYTKIEYTINVQEFSKEVLKAYQEDSEIITILSNLSELDEKDIKDSIKDALEGIEKSKDEDTIIINTYVKGFSNELLEIEVVEDDSKFVLDNDNNVYKYYFESDGEKILSGEYNAKEESFTLESDEGFSLKVTTEKDSEKISFDYNMGTESVSITATITNKVTGSSQENNMTVDVTYKSGDEKIIATINNDMTITKNQKVEKMNTKQTIDMDDIKESDMEKITTAAYEKIEELIEDIIPAYAESGTSFRKIIG